jgi:hypothetical protein
MRIERRKPFLVFLRQRVFCIGAILASGLAFPPSAILRIELFQVDLAQSGT